VSRFKIQLIRDFDSGIEFNHVFQSIIEVFSITLIEYNVFQSIIEFVFYSQSLNSIVFRLKINFVL
jgi:hypothetical protein